MDNHHAAGLELTDHSNSLPKIAYAPVFAPRSLYHFLHISLMRARGCCKLKVW